MGYAHHSEREAVWDRVAQALSNRMPALRLVEAEITIDYSAAPTFRGVLPPPSVSYMMNNCIKGKLATLESRGITVEVAVKTPRCLRMYSFIASNSSQSIFVKLRILQHRIPPRKVCNNLLEGFCWLVDRNYVEVFIPACFSYGLFPEYLSYLSRHCCSCIVKSHMKGKRLPIDY